MKTSQVCFAVFAMVAAGSLGGRSVAGQAPQGPPPGMQGGPSGPAGGMHHQAPTNLKVLPKTTTGDQIHEIMENWAGSLGVQCKTCHAEDPKNMGQNGRPRLNFADDSKPQKQTARMMFTMTESINKDYVMKIEGAEHPVTCGTCHRGKLDPEPFVVPEEHHGPPGGAGAPAGPPAPQP